MTDAVCPVDRVHTLQVGIARIGRSATAPLVVAENIMMIILIRRAVTIRIPRETEFVTQRSMDTAATEDAMRKESSGGKPKPKTKVKKFDEVFVL